MYSQFLNATTIVQLLTLTSHVLLLGKRHWKVCIEGNCKRARHSVQLRSHGETGQLLKSKYNIQKSPEQVPHGISSTTEK